MNANTGQSSGGHSAIRLGHLVYHFQFYPDKIFHIVREPWEEFRYVYGIQENRTIWIRKIKLSKENYNFFLDRMNEIYLIQKKELDNLVKLENDVKILESIIYGDKSVHLKAAGYFSTHSSKPENYQSVHRKINSALGNNFVLKSLTSTRKKLFNFNIPQKEPIKINLNSRHYPTGVENFSSEYLDLLSLLKSLEVLYESNDLNPFSYYVFQSKDYSTLNEVELKKLSLFGEELEDEILQLLKSSSDNRGYPLLVLIARYQVIQKSISEKRFYFLDAFGKNHSLVIGNVLEEKGFLNNINEELTRKISLNFKNLFEPERIHGKEYTMLEDVVNRQREILNGINQSRSIRINYELLIPAKEENVLLSHRQIPIEALKLNFDSSISNKTQYEIALQKKYSFNLFSKNCTTEIFHSLNSFYEKGKEESKEKLGGVVEGSDFLVFVPVYAYYAVGKNYRVGKELTIPSLRTQILEKNSSKGFLFSLQESSTLTSKFYKFNQEDSFFIFFTDDTIWQRPIYGFVNLIAGVGEVGVGICLSPFDKGERFIKGLQGVFFSGPELLFFNIRKGNFIYEGRVEEGEEFND